MIEKNAEIEEIDDKESETSMNHIFFSFLKPELCNFKNYHLSYSVVYLGKPRAQLVNDSSNRLSIEDIVNLDSDSNSEVELGISFVEIGCEWEVLMIFQFHFLRTFFTLLK